MKRKLSLFSILVLTCFFLATICQAQDSKKRFSLKLTVGYGSMAVGDINTVLESQENYLDYAASLGYAKEGELKELNRGGFEYEGEFIINITERFGLGIGAGYIQRKEQTEASISSVYNSVSFSHHPTISAIPIKITAYYSIPIASRLNSYLSGGIGYYIGKIDYNYIWEWREWLYEDTFAEAHYEIEMGAKENAFGFHGGIGFEYDVKKNCAIFIEGIARYAKLNDWRGDRTTKSFGEIAEERSGPLWYYELLYPLISYPEPDQYLSLLIILEDKPTSPIIRNTRRAEGDFSGYSLRAGIKIKF